MSSAEQPKYCSVEEYLASEEQALIKSEYIDGWVRAMTGASIRHNCIQLNCLIQLGNQLRGKPCRPFDSDTKLRIDRGETKRFYYPDLQVVCQSNDPLSVFQDHPVLIVEVLSPSTRRYDLDEKMTAYLSVPSLEVYIALEQHQPIAIVMRRSAGGFLRQTIHGIDRTIELPFLECLLPMREVYEGIEFTATCVQEPDPEYELTEET
jgi:Uma2 family endonuclease